MQTTGTMLQAESSEPPRVSKQKNGCGEPQTVEAAKARKARKTTEPAVNIEEESATDSESAEASGKEDDGSATDSGSSGSEETDNDEQE